ncbi:pimeloyl-ACP methyl ester carboxylesterase [Saccharothrix tamanrassetensis]|uniref:Pimeloyl-ACP methyl ester carboxylesterase n=1 Tax=Saccharothrix tamanrassetensis TaxID=1051531 RepID=A0A841CGK8_9PSEU|nr:alpha/beta hydrolase [Saccharothrix tamanrassetensis]MBB5956130.1 pimeloyl-ACP methyl ester carboxylesterase [Saccharothrix tamanrassetensis]
MAPLVPARVSARTSAPWAPDHRFPTSDGTALHVLDTGPRDSPVTTVLIHGWTLDHTSWDLVAPALPGRVLRYDHRGHGRSAASSVDGSTIARCADDLAELIAARVPTGRIVFAGHSMGGMTLMALAEQHPGLLDRVAGIVFVNTSSGGLSGSTLGLPGVLGRAFVAGEAASNRRLAKLRRAQLSQRTGVLRPGLRWLLFGKRPSWRDVASTAAMVGRCNPVAMVAFRASIDAHDRVKALKQFAGIPTVVLAGGSDRLTPLRHARLVADEVPHAELVIYPGAGHMLPLERSAEVTAHITALL